MEQVNGQLSPKTTTSNYHIMPNETQEPSAHSQSYEWNQAAVHGIWALPAIGSPSWVPKCWIGSCPFVAVRSAITKAPQVNSDWASTLKNSWQTMGSFLEVRLILPPLGRSRGVILIAAA
jgi:hypothetical protein